MKDIWVVWLTQGLIFILFLVVWFWIKRWVNQQDDRWKKYEEEWMNQGGVVTRNKFFDWCLEGKSKCAALISYGTLIEWRNTMLSKGGPMVKEEFLALSKEMNKEVNEKFCERIDELFEHHREWVGQEMKLLRMEISKAREK